MKKNEYTLENVWERMDAERLTSKNMLIDEILNSQLEIDVLGGYCNTLTSEDIENYAIYLLKIIVTAKTTSIDQAEFIKKNIAELIDEPESIFRGIRSLSPSMHTTNRYIADELLGYESDIPLEVRNWLNKVLKR